MQHRYSLQVRRGDVETTKNILHNVLYLTQLTCGIMVLVKKHNDMHYLEYLKALKGYFGGYNAHRRRVFLQEPSKDILQAIKSEIDSDQDLKNEVADFMRRFLSITKYRNRRGKLTINEAETVIVKAARRDNPEIYNSIVGHGGNKEDLAMNNLTAKELFERKQQLLLKKKQREEQQQQQSGFSFLGLNLLSFRRK